VPEGSPERVARADVTGISVAAAYRSRRAAERRAARSRPRPTHRAP
jgi:hypothetical protein